MVEPLTGAIRQTIKIHPAVFCTFGGAGIDSGRGIWLRYQFLSAAPPQVSYLAFPNITRLEPRKRRQGYTGLPDVRQYQPYWNIGLAYKNYRRSGAGKIKKPTALSDHDGHFSHQRYYG